jgi:DNA invertase Pin-like site-specific DNA recombinase
MPRKSRKHLHEKSIEQTPKTIEPSYIAGIYTRISSQEQKEDSIENQRNIAEGYIRDNHDIKLYKVYVDYGISSFDRHRPGFDEMLLDIETKSINCVIVKDISRFTRDYIEAGEYLQRIFPLWSIRFVSVNDNFDSLRDDATQLKTALWSLLSFQYSIELSKKIQQVITTKLEAGSYIPAKFPYGYKKVRTGQGVEWIRDEQTATVVQEIFKSALSGLSAYAIAGKMNKQKIPAPSSKYWSNGSVIRILKNTTYIGTLVTGKTRNKITAGRKTIQLPRDAWVIHHEHHEQIIDETTFHAVQRILSDRNSFTAKRSKAEDYFLGKLYCGICGRKMRLKRSVNGNMYYICPLRDVAGSSCPNKAKSELKIKAQVFHTFSDIINELRTDYLNTVAYEKSPYFQKKVDEQDKMVEIYKKKLNHYLEVFKRLYEKSITNHTNSSADTQGLLRHMLHVRTVLQEQLASVLLEKDEYQINESSGASKFQPYLMFHECGELTPQMLDEMVEKVYVDMDGIRLMKKQIIDSPNQ